MQRQTIKISSLYGIIGLIVMLSGCISDLKETGFHTYGQEGYFTRQIGQMPSEINESSGLIFNASDSTLWTQNDGGSASALFRIDKKGRLLNKIDFPGLKNVDWEEITKDSAGNIYIGDFGNNKNLRKNLRIYKFHPERPDLIDTIRFRYADQTAFPPPKSQQNFDCEAFFWYKNQLYLFSKNRGDRIVHYYAIPDKPGSYVVNPSKSGIYLHSMVTGAALSPDKKKIVLLAYGRVYFFKITDESNLFASPDICLRMSRGQGEAIDFISQDELIFSTEMGKLFKLKLLADSSLKPTSLFPR
jgi:hypothetical protein